MPDNLQKIEQIIAKLDQIGMIGSPSSTVQLTLDILQTAVNKKLVGELAVFNFLQDNREHYAIGQITEVELRNVWLEGASLRSIARQKGIVNPVSGQQDTHLGKITVSAVFSKETDSVFEQSILGNVPATGTAILLANDDLLNKILESQQANLFYLGKVFGSKPLLPMQFRHFGSGVNGAGEAYHIGVFGKTGSGKSHLTKMILTAYMRFPEMGMLILDPQGEFSKDFKNNMRFPLQSFAQKFGKEAFSMSVAQLLLDRWEMFDEILFESPFFEKLTMRKNENRQLACSFLIENLKKRNIRLDSLSSRESFEEAWRILNKPDIQVKIYKSDGPREILMQALESANKDEFYENYWKPVAELFNANRSEARTVEKALAWLLKTKSVLVIDLSGEKVSNIFWNEKIQAMVIKRLLSGLITIADSFYKNSDSLNTLVVIDEAHRLAKRENPTDEVEKGVKSILERAVKETRKYGLGWMFISQTLASLDKEIINQLRINFFGFGLSMGTEYQSLRELAGGDNNSLKLYQSFRDPHSALNPENRQYSFMSIGPVSPLSFSGSPLFFTAFNIEDFKTNNISLR